jgi:competence protein ComEA
VREGDEEQAAVRRRLRRLVEGAPPGSAVAGAHGEADEPATSARTGVDGGPGDPAGGWTGGWASAFDPGRRGVRVLAAVAALVVLAAGVLAWRARPRAEPVGLLPPNPPAVVTPAATAGEIVVAVAGRVRRPGLVRLPAGARVADALEAAGGALPGTDVEFLNLARPVADGELIVVGVTPPPGGVDAGAGGQGPGVGGKIGLNTATLAQLDTLPGVGPVLAQRILDYRAKHGRFRSVGELRQVEGIGDTRYEQLKELVTV